ERQGAHEHVIRGFLHGETWNIGARSRLSSRVGCRAMNRLLVGIGLVLAGCGADMPDTSPLAFGTMGPLVGDAGKGDFRFGVATASTQIEDMNTNTDWYVWTLHTAMGGPGKDTFVGAPTRGYT